jgi:prepilin-type N-terminal cleavage/methylation domain-containing protein
MSSVAGSTVRGGRTRGFTLVELMLVIVIIAIIAAIALPNFLSSRVVSNEAAAIQTLRAIASAQSSLQVRKSIDNDAVPDGIGEFGYLAELAGTVNIRGAAAPLGPPTLGAKLGTIQNGACTTAGYHFAMFLPGPGAVGVPEDPGGGLAAVGAVDPDLCEWYWVCYAWPANLNATGNRVFAVNHTGDVVASDNRAAGQSYEGLANRPAFDAAYPVAGSMDAPFAPSSAPAADGGIWRPVH